VSIQGAVFDLGWTLIDFSKDVPTAVENCVRDLDSFFRGNGFELDCKAVFDDYFQEVRVLWQAGDAFLYEYPASLSMLRALRRHVPGPDAARLTAGVMRDGFVSIIASWQLFPDVLDTLAALRDAGYRLGCVSNINDGHIMRSVVEREKLHNWLWPIYLSEDVGLRKPHPRLFQMVLDDWELPPDQVVMVGDNRKTDIQGAQNAGLRGIWLDRDVDHPWRRIEGDASDIIPDATIQQLSELPGLLVGGWGH
jgi:HAD superfamily hydrolase (TIGR01662 family)